MTHEPVHAAPRPRTASRAAATTVLGLALALVGGGAVADTRVVNDPDDSRTIDIRKVRIVHGHDWLRVRVEHDGHVRAGQLYVFWIDTRPRNPGPEYYASFRPNAEVPPLQRVSGFGDRTKTSTGCEQVGGTADIMRPHQDVTFRVATACLHHPRRVRVSVHVFGTDGASRDWAPGFRRLSPWVPRAEPPRRR